MRIHRLYLWLSECITNFQRENLTGMVNDYDNLLASIRLTTQVVSKRVYIQNKSRAATYAALWHALIEEMNQCSAKITAKSFIFFVKNKILENNWDGPQLVSEKKLVNWFNNNKKLK